MSIADLERERLWDWYWKKNCGEAFSHAVEYYKNRPELLINLPKKRFWNNKYEKELFNLQKKKQLEIVGKWFKEDLK